MNLKSEVTSRDYNSTVSGREQRAHEKRDVNTRCISDDSFTSRYTQRMIGLGLQPRDGTSNKAPLSSLPLTASINHPPGLLAHFV